MRWYPANDHELLVLLKHPNREMRTIGWNIFFALYEDALYRDARRSLLKRGVNDNLEEDTMAIVREVWIKIQANIHLFEYRHEGALFHYVRSYLAYEAWNLRHRRQRELRRLAREVSLDEAQERWGDTAENILLGLINRFQLVDTAIEVPEEITSELEQLAADLAQRLNPDEVALLQERLVGGHEYADLARQLGITPNNARQRIFRARRRFIATFLVLVQEAYVGNRISYGTYRWLMTCANGTNLNRPAAAC